MKTYNRYLNTYTSHTQAGFTLIELMISMVLGLLIILAALALFFGSSKNLRVQDAAADVQDASTFGLKYIKSEIAMANLGANTPAKQASPWTGIVLTGSEETKDGIPNSTPAALRHVGNLRGVSDPSRANPNLTPLLTIGSVNKGSSGDSISNIVQVDSDQLTIQYEAPFALTDCEGNTRAEGDIVVERFFTRPEIGITGDDAYYNIVLACDAGWYRLDTPANPNLDVTPSRIAADTFVLTGLGDAGVVLVNRVDYFNVRLGVMLENGMTYMPISRYMTVASKDPVTDENIYVVDGPIIAIQMGVIVRGVEPIATQTPISFDVLDNAVTIENDEFKYVRRVYESTVFLRNGAIL